MMLLIGSVCMLFLPGCGHREETPASKETLSSVSESMALILSCYSEFSTNKEVSIALDQASSEKVTLYILNQGDSEVRTGNAWSYVLEKQIDGIWYEVETAKKNHTDEAFSCKKDQPLVQNLSLAAKFGALPCGHYRIVKKIIIDGETEYYSAEFDLNIQDSSSEKTDLSTTN